MPAQDACGDRAAQYIVPKLGLPVALVWRLRNAASAAPTFVEFVRGETGR